VLKTIILLVFFNENFIEKRSEKDSNILRIYDAKGTNQPLHKLEKLHYQPIHLIKVNFSLMSLSRFNFSNRQSISSIQYMMLWYQQIKVVKLNYRYCF
jgi:hypothetical protein